jgi:hypothetical protein
MTISPRRRRIMLAWREDGNRSPRRAQTPRQRLALWPTYLDGLKARKKGSMNRARRSEFRRTRDNLGLPRVVTP